MIRMRVPATIANVGPAFDVLGIAVSLYNTVEMDLASLPHVEVYGEGAGALPADERNLIYRAAASAAAAANRPSAFRLRCRNHVPLGRGLGSSAAAIIAGAAGANALLGGPLSRQEILDLAWALEGHPDNVAAALLGGVVLVDGAGAHLNATRLMPAWQVALIVCVPDVTVATEDARRVLPDDVPFRDAVANIGRAAHLVTAVLTGRTELLRCALDDALHQPYRRALMPAMDDVISAARDAGAFGAALAGSGPSIVAAAPRGIAAHVGRAMVTAFSRAGHTATYRLVRIDTEGAVVLDPAKSNGRRRGRWRRTH